MALPVTEPWLQSTGFDQDIATYSGAWTVREGAFSVRNAIGRVDGNGSGYNLAYRNDETFAANQYSQGVLLGSAGVYRGVAVGVQAGAGIVTAYHVETDYSSVYLSRDWNNGTQQRTTLYNFSQTFAASDVLRLEREISGPNVLLRIYRALAASPTSFTQVGSTFTDTTNQITAAGFAGIFAYDPSSGAGIGEWKGGNLGGGSSSIAAHVARLTRVRRAA